MKGWLLVVLSVAAVWVVSTVWQPSGGWYFTYYGLLSLLIMEACHRASVSDWLKSAVIGCEIAAIITNIGALTYYYFRVLPIFYDYHEVYMYALAAVELVALAVYPFSGALNGIYQRSTSIIGRIRAAIVDWLGRSRLGMAEGGK